jgi:hypothetical protein
VSSLPADRATTGRARPRHRQGLTRKQAKERVAERQWWDHIESEVWWRVRSIDVRAGLVLLERPGGAQRSVTFGELGSQYRLSEQDAG